MVMEHIKIFMNLISGSWLTFQFWLKQTELTDNMKATFIF
jgi:hypothetical protein